MNGDSGDANARGWRNAPHNPPPTHTRRTLARMPSGLPLLTISASKKSPKHFRWGFDNLRWGQKATDRTVSNHRNQAMSSNPTRCPLRTLFRTCQKPQDGARQLSRLGMSGARQDLACVRAQGLGGGQRFPASPQRRFCQLAKRFAVITRSCANQLELRCFRFPFPAPKDKGDASRLLLHLMRGCVEGWGEMSVRGCGDQDSRT